MDFNRLTQNIEGNNLILRTVSEDDRAFINEMFNDFDIKRYFIVPKEAQQDPKRLLDYWRNDIRNGAGNCWIVYQKGKGLFSRDKQVGFIAFEFRDSLKNARISYAILPKYRRKGIATTSVHLILEKLKDEGVERVEADIDIENLNSEKVVEKLGFTANKRHGLVDPEMMRDGEIRVRALWKKKVVEFSESNSTGRIPLTATIEKLVPEINALVEKINSKEQTPSLLVRYFYLLGRIKFLERNYEEAQEAFGQCNIITMKEGFPEIHENYYWFAKINEAKGEPGNAKMYYGFALERYNDNPNYISKAEIEREMNI